MSTVVDIECAIEKLPPQELALFERGLPNRLDGLADEAIDDLRDGRCKDL